MAGTHGAIAEWGAVTRHRCCFHMVHMNACMTRARRLQTKRQAGTGRDSGRGDVVALQEHAHGDVGGGEKRELAGSGGQQVGVAAADASAAMVTARLISRSQTNVKETFGMQHSEHAQRRTHNVLTSQPAASFAVWNKSAANSCCARAAAIACRCAPWPGNSNM